MSVDFLLYEGIGGMLRITRNLYYSHTREEYMYLVMDCICACRRVCGPSRMPVCKLQRSLIVDDREIHVMSEPRGRKDR